MFQLRKANLFAVILMTCLFGSGDLSVPQASPITVAKDGKRKIDLSRRQRMLHSAWLRPPVTLVPEAGPGQQRHQVVSSSTVGPPVHRLSTTTKASLLKRSLCPWLRWTLAQTIDLTPTVLPIYGFDIPDDVLSMSLPPV